MRGFRIAVLSRACIISHMNLSHAWLSYLNKCQGRVRVEKQGPRYMRLRYLYVPADTGGAKLRTCKDAYDSETRVKVFLESIFTKALLSPALVRALSSLFIHEMSTVSAAAVLILG